jgi:hypothetical protein
MCDMVVLLTAPTLQDKETITSLLVKVKSNIRGDEVRIIFFETLFRLLTEEEKSLVRRMLDIDPTIYGFRGPFLGVLPVPSDLTAIAGQVYIQSGVTKTVETQYLPKPVYDACQKLNDAMYTDIGKRVLIESGYRSPAYQAIVFLRYMQGNNFDIAKTAERIAIPGYSEHGFPEKQGMDFRTGETVFHEEGRPVTFSETIEYTWLREHAGIYGFVLSYPEDNPWGIIFEPWHWRFEGQTISGVL